MPNKANSLGQPKASLRSVFLPVICDVMLLSFFEGRAWVQWK